MSVPWSTVTGWRLCGAGLLKVHCTQRRARTPASMQQAKWTFLESLGLFNTPLGLKVTLLVLPGWRWRWWFCYESGFCGSCARSGRNSGGTSSLEWNWLHHLPLKPTVRLPGTESNSFAVVFFLSVFVSLSTSLFFALALQKRVWVWPRRWLEAQSKLALLGPCSESFSYQRNLLPLLLPKAPLQQTLKRSGNDKFHTQLCSELYCTFLIRAGILMFV